MANFCPNCGAKTGNGRFCTECGETLDSAAASPPAGGPAQTPAQQPSQAPSYQAPPSPAPVSAAPQQPSYQQPADTTYPQQPVYQQPPQYQGYPQQPVSAPAKPKKKRRVPLVVKIIIGVLLAIVLLVVGIVVFARVAVGNAAKADYYEIGGEEVASVKLALGEERTVTGVSSSVEDGVSTKSYEYTVDGGDPGLEMYEYLTYLNEQDGFFFATDHDFTKPTGSGIQMGRESQEEGYVVIVQVDYDRNGYTVTLMRGQASFTPREEDAPAAPAGLPADLGIGGSGSSEPSQPAATGDADLLRWMANGTYYIEFIQITGGQQIGSGMMAYENGTLGAFLIPNEDGSVIRMILDGDVAYVIDDESQLIFRISGVTANEFTVVEDMTGLTETSSGQAEINGRTLPYTDYLTEDGSTSRIFFENGQVYAFGSPTFNNYLIITKQSERAPAGTFDLPNYDIYDAEN